MARSTPAETVRRLNKAGNPSPGPAVGLARPIDFRIDYMAISKAFQNRFIGMSLLAWILLAGCAPSAREAAVPLRPDPVVLPDLPQPSPVSAEEYRQRRELLAASMEDGVLIAFGGIEPEPEFLPYGQNSTFRYLTGLTDPGSSLIMVKSGDQVASTLFVRERDPAREIWDGARLGTDGATRATSLAARPAGEFLPTLTSVAAQMRTVYTLAQMIPDTSIEATMTREQQVLRGLLDDNPGVQLLPLSSAVQTLRSTKSPVELDLIRRAALITSLAHREAIRSTTPGMNEFEIQGLIEYVFRRSGADRPAFGSIVGSGPNSTTLHYRGAERFMQAGELLLMDIGASYRGYAADITRTIPVSGRYTPAQRDIYAIVLEALKNAEDAISVGGSWADLNSAANQSLERGLARLGLIDAPGATYYCVNPAANDRCSQLRLFYMHALGHGVGLDVHDPDVSSSKGFQIGSAFTLEPGIYVRGDVLDYLPETPDNRAMIERLRPAVNKYRDTGVRIEEMYLVTSAGVERPSSAVPREMVDIEGLMGEAGIGEYFRRPTVVDWYRTTTPAR